MGCGASHTSTINNDDAPHLTEYFQMLEAHVKKETANGQNAIAMMMDPAKFKKEQERKANAEKALNVKLETIIGKAFAHHDKNGNDTLDPDESHKFFKNYVDIQAQFHNVISAYNKEKANQMAIKMMGGMPKQMLDALKETAAKQIQEEVELVKICEDEYSKDPEKYNKAAFDAVDVNKDQKLVKDEIVKALSLGTPEHDLFENAFPTGPKCIFAKQMAKIEEAMKALGL
jgi:hypothetical protein